MICYPLDNTEYEANALGAWCGTRTRGVFAAEGHYAVTANANMTVTVSSGLAWLKADQFWGVAALEPNAQVLAIGTADGSLSRIDTVCVRLDKNQNRGELIIKKGAYSPQPPVIVPPVRNLDFDEIYVATVMVRAGATSILPTDITDRRLDETYCGIMRDGVTGIPTAQLQAQVQELIDQLRTVIAGIEQGSEVMLQTIYDPQGKATDIFAAIPGRNLLGNGNFTNPINQRGRTSYSFDEGYTVDMWKLRFSGDGTLTIADGYISLYSPTHSVYLHQIVEHQEWYGGKKLTLSARVKGKGGIGFYLNDSRAAVKDFDSSEWVTVTLTHLFSALSPASTLSAEIFTAANSRVDVQWVKLEEGEVATAFIPNSYGAELIDCMRYFQWVAKPGKDYSIPCSFSATVAEIDYRCPVPMRILPSLVLTRAEHPNAYGRIVFLNSAGGVAAVKTISSIQIGSADENRVTLIATYDAQLDVSSFGQGSYDTFTGGSIALSAEL